MFPPSLLNAAVQVKNVTAIMGHYCTSEHYARFSWSEIELISHLQQSCAAANVSEYDLSGFETEVLCQMCQKQLKQDNFFQL